MSTQQHRQEYEDGDIKITPVRHGDSCYFDVQEVGNPGGTIKFIPLTENPEDALVEVKR